VVVVESRIKWQTAIQEYLLKHGFHCLVAAELHQARSLLSLLDVDAVIVSGSWYETDDLAAFRDALVEGGPSLPASVVFLHGTSARQPQRFAESPRHRLVREGVSLRELRQLLAAILGDPAKGSQRRRPAKPRGTKAGDPAVAPPDDAQRPSAVPDDRGLAEKGIPG
jgi:hypothetical protein